MSAKLAFLSQIIDCPLKQRTLQALAEPEKVLQNFLDYLRVPSDNFKRSQTDQADFEKHLW